ncbi:Protein FLC EXPRESSOR [Zea mays]|nr:Protein FLC EXPRESSOR [Zea mays]
MEKNMIAVASEIERLRGELANAEKGATAVNPAAAVGNSGYAAPYGNSASTYTGMYGNPDATYTAQAYPDAYSTNQGHMHTVANPHYMSQPVPYGQYESQHTNVQR